MFQHQMQVVSKKLVEEHDNRAMNCDLKFKDQFL
jgi:hypothetical protein